VNWEEVESLVRSLSHNDLSELVLDLIAAQHGRGDAFDLDGECNADTLGEVCNRIAMLIGGGK
jgi:hypothetical protein